MRNVVIYGDSILRGVTPDANNRYTSVLEQFMPGLEQKHGLCITNRARFGCTVEKGYALAQKDLAAQPDFAYALIEYGGNDCDYSWQSIARDPNANHQPHTPLARFVHTLETLLNDLIKNGIQPLLMTLPPIDAQKYFSFVCKNEEDKRGVLQWLGDVQLIYHFQEMYSAAVLKLALGKRLPLIDVRSYFLDRHDYRALISADGIHPTERGYALIHTAFDAYLAKEA
ncbi:MAG: SGNH/GDSL hydrolase family protein [Christensenellaceae bacterium]|jgi:lysophospholipase L1-like esterase|nr:SGNH/GDSL hydrolase family protein [Christensenellaceae bacterium]